jgi:hypothetical protein
MMISISATEGVRLAKISQCENRLELLVDPGMSSELIRQWAYMAVDNWLASRVDLTSPSDYDSRQKGGDHG